LTEGKNKCRITAYNLPIPLEKTEFVTYSLPLSPPAKRFRFERHIKTLSQRIMTTYRLLIAIEHALPNWPLVDFRKKALIRGYFFNTLLISINWLKNLGFSKPVILPQFSITSSGVGILFPSERMTPSPVMIADLLK